jgi:hypothetical protein
MISIPLETRDPKAPRLPSVYNVEPKKRRYHFTHGELEHVRATLPFRHETDGPRNKREAEHLRAHHNGWAG